MTPISAPSALVTLNSIRKVFDKKTVIPDLSLTLSQGEFVTLLGPSGCGKTTLLRLIAGLESPDQGTLLLNESDITALPAEQRPVGTVFQNYALFPHMSVAENVGFSLRMQRRPTTEIHQRVTEALEMVQLADFAGYRPAQLSGGQQQRVAIARAVISRPALLLLDEPLSALDFPLRKQMQNQLKILQQRLGITFIFVTHDRQEAMALSDRIVVLKDGQVMQDGSPQTIYQQPASLFVAGFIGEVNQLTARVLSPLADEEALVSVGGYQNRVQCRWPVHAGDQVQLLVRPEDLSITPAESHPGVEGIPGSIHHSDYQGRIIETSVSLFNGEKVIACQLDNDTTRQMASSLGLPVMVSWPAGRAQVFPAETQSALA